MHKAAWSPELMARTANRMDPDVDRFLLNLAVCNTVVPSKADDGTLQYQVGPGQTAYSAGRKVMLLCLAVLALKMRTRCL